MDHAAPSSDPSRALEASLNRILQACEEVAVKAAEVRAALPPDLPEPFRRQLLEFFALVERHLA